MAAIATQLPRSYHAGLDSYRYDRFLAHDNKWVYLPLWRWVAVFIAGCAGLVVAGSLPNTGIFAFDALMPCVTLTALPLVTFLLLAGPRRGALFKRAGLASVAAAVVYGMWSFSFTVILAVIVEHFTPMTAHPSGEAVSHMTGVQTIIYHTGTVIQLLGEEFLSIVPFMIVLECLRRIKTPYIPAVAIAMLVATMWFGALHIATYGNNLAQAFLVIGLGHIVSLCVFVATRNIWVTYIAHVVHDAIPLALLPLLSMLR